MVFIGGGGRHSILTNTAIDGIPADHADHNDSQFSLGDAGIEFAEELFVPVFEQHVVFLFVRHEVPAFPAIDPSPELRVIHVSTSQPQCIQCPTRKAVTSPINSFPHSGHLSPIIQSPVFFIMQKIAMRTDCHIIDIDFIVTFFNCAFHSIILQPLARHDLC